MPPADDPTRKNPVTLPDKCSLLWANPNVLGNTGAIEIPKPMTHVQINAGEEGRINNAAANSAARLINS